MHVEAAIVLKKLSMGSVTKNDAAIKAMDYDSGNDWKAAVRATRNMSYGTEFPRDARSLPKNFSVY